MCLQEAVEDVRYGADKAGEKAAHVVHKVEHAAEHAGHVVASSVRGAVDNVKTNVHQAEDVAESAADAALHKAQKLTSKARNYVGEKLHEVGEKFHEAGEKVEEEPHVTKRSNNAAIYTGGTATTSLTWHGHMCADMAWTHGNSYGHFMCQCLLPVNYYLHFYHHTPSTASITIKALSHNDDMDSI